MGGRNGVAGGIGTVCIAAWTGPVRIGPCYTSSLRNGGTRHE